MMWTIGEVELFVRWCDETKELIIDFRREKKEVIEPVFINNQKVQIVQTYILVSIWTVN